MKDMSTRTTQQKSFISSGYVLEGSSKSLGVALKFHSDNNPICNEEKSNPVLVIIMDAL